MTHREVHGAISLLTCRSCGATTPMFVFEGDTDAVTDGLCSAGRVEPLEIAIVELTANEWDALGKGDTQPAMERIAHELGRTGFHIPVLIRTETSIPLLV